MPRQNGRFSPDLSRFAETARSAKTPRFFSRIGSDKNERVCSFLAYPPPLRRADPPKNPRRCTGAAGAPFRGASLPPPASLGSPTEHAFAAVVAGADRNRPGHGLF